MCRHIFIRSRTLDFLKCIHATGDPREARFILPSQNFLVFESHVSACAVLFTTGTRKRKAVGSSSLQSVAQ